MKRIPAAPGRAVDFARSPPAGAFVGFVYYSALFPGRRLFPPVEQHSQHAAAGSQHQADPQRHRSRSGGCSRFWPRRFFPCAYAISSLYRTGAPCEESGAPHAPQKRLPAVSPPRTGAFVFHRPQLLQNLAPAAHWVLQAGQTTIPAFSSAPAFRTTTERPPKTMHCSITWKISYGSFFCL